MGLEGFDFVVDLVEWSGWGVGVEVAGEGDFVSDFGFGGVVPGVGDVGVDFFLEVVVDGVLVLGGVEPSGGVCFVGDSFGGLGDVFVVAEGGVGFGFVFGGDGGCVGVRGPKERLATALTSGAGFFPMVDMSASRTTVLMVFSVW